jgi:OOP family OmpA-OmpF porin
MLPHVLRLVSVVLTVLAAAAAAPSAVAQGAPETVRVRAVAHFGPDSDRLAGRDRDALLADVAKLSDVSWKSVTATGHTDSIGSDAYNQRLGRQRADSVRRYLLAKGLDPAMVRAESASESAPVADNATAAGRARNRRAEVEFEGVRVVR